MPKRASCLIIGRHPQVPREVRVVCKQLTGILQLGDCCSHLNIKTQGSKIMTPPEFEAAAGCSKGKNWKVSFGAAAACDASCSPPPPLSPLPSQCLQCFVLCCHAQQSSKLASVKLPLELLLALLHATCCASQPASRSYCCIG